MNEEDRVQVLEWMESDDFNDGKPCPPELSKIYKSVASVYMNSRYTGTIYDWLKSMEGKCTS